MEHRRDNTKGTDNSTKRSKTEDPSSPHSTAGYDNKLYTDRKHQEKKYDEQFRKDIDDQDAKQRRELRLKATGGWHPSAGDLPNTPEHRMRGGTPEEAKEFLNDLKERNKPAFDAYKKYQSLENHYRYLVRTKQYEDSLGRSPVERASAEEPEGYDVYLEEKKIRERPKQTDFTEEWLKKTVELP